MGKSPFYFKQFVIRQDKCSMKVGTDSVLLGACVSKNHDDVVREVLDIGTGNGVIAIMMGQFFDAHIDAIDIDKNSCEQAIENARACPWNKRLKIYHTSLQQYAKRCRKKYDLIISNPPYFVNATKAAEKGRNNARHADTNLTHEELIDGVTHLLKKSGSFCLILPRQEAYTFIKKSLQKNLYCNKIVHIRTKKEKPPKRMIMRFAFKKKEMNETELIVHNEDLSFTQDYINLTKDYYLVF